MEGVAVAVGETGKRHAAQDLLTGAWFHADPHLREAPSSTSKATPARQPSGSHACRPVRVHCSAPARSASTVARASTPTRQSSGSAHSAGE